MKDVEYIIKSPFKVTDDTNTPIEEINDGKCVDAHGKYRTLKHGTNIGSGMKSFKLTQKQQEMLDYLEEYRALYGHSPDRTRMAKDSGLTKLAITSKLLSLFLKGAVIMGEHHYSNNRWYNIVAVKGSTYHKKFVEGEVIECQTIPQNGAEILGNKKKRK